MKFFGSSGIRGIVNEKLTPELAIKIGRAIGRDYKRVLIGRDPRQSGEMLLSAVTAGLTSEGADVYDTGMVPTPTLAFGARDYDCGIMITASHNPAPYNGVKLWNPDGSSFNTEQMKRTEYEMETQSKLPPWDSVGRVREHHGLVNHYIKYLLEEFGTDHSLKVVVDCANGAGCAVSPFFLREMGCDVFTLNANPDGTFPAHPPEPTEKNLTSLSKAVTKTGADLGIAHDGDGDRMVAFDSRGRYLGGDKLLTLFASLYSEKVVVPINASMAIDEVADEVIRTKVGDVFVAEAMKKHDAAFGGEPSGTWIFPPISYAPDAFYASAVLIELAEEGELDDMIEYQPSFPRETVSFRTKNRHQIMEELEDNYKEKYPMSSLNLIDGIRRETSEGWSLIRASGTEPKLRLTVEAKDENSLKELKKEEKDNLEKVMR